MNMESLLRAIDLVEFVPNENEQEVVEIILNAIPIRFNPPCAHRTCKHMKCTCAIIGCSLPVLLNSPYCCPSHGETALANSGRPQAFHYFDGFNSRDEQHVFCVVALLHALEGVHVGVPAFDTTVFNSPPWVQQDRFFTDLKVDWLFFVNTFTKMSSMSIANGVKMVWHGQNKRQVTVSCLPRESVVILLPYKLRITSDPDTPEAKAQSLIAEEWRLFRYQLNDVHLFCLTRGPPDTDPRVTTTTKIEEKIPKTEAEAEGGGKRAKKAAGSGGN